MSKTWLSAPYPQGRLRRLRMNDSVRQLVRENHIMPADLIQPFFIIDGENQKQPIDTMPEIFRFSIDLLCIEIQKCYDLGMRAVALFPVTPSDKKDMMGSHALDSNNLMCRAVRALKQSVPDMLLITDVALDPYTTHGHDGLLDDRGLMKNDETIDILCSQALNQARAGADIIAPSDMCDGRVGRIRECLESAGFHHIIIISYAAKYASSFYAPFRDAVGSQGNLKSDKKNYQMDYCNSDEAMREIALDISEGADMIIVKPATFYLDIIQRATQEFNVPVMAYQVSGEYAMLMGGIRSGLFPRDALITESLMAFKRAGCKGILTYFAQSYLQNIHK